MKEGLAELEKCVDTLIVIPNQKLLELDNKALAFKDAFALVDEVLYQGIKGVTDVLVKPGLINLDFADVRTIMTDMGRSLMGTGEAEGWLSSTLPYLCKLISIAGRGRAKSAAEQALHNPLLEDVQIRGAKGVRILLVWQGGI
jgi:cell division protein FtsZ